MSYFDDTQYDTELAEVSSSLKGNRPSQVGRGCHNSLTQQIQDAKMFESLYYSPR